VKNDLAAIRRLVGTVTKEQLRYVDCFVSDEIALFMPMGGPCFYALTPEHTHPAYMFILNFTDQTLVKIDGKIVPGRPGKVFALSPGVPHQELPLDSPPRYICALIDRKFFEKQYWSCSGKKPAFSSSAFFDAHEGLALLLKRFMAEADSGIPGGKAVLAALGVEICHSLIRSIIKTPAVKSRVEERVEIGRAIEHIHSNLGEKIVVEDMASVARLSPSHFARVFKKETGKAPMEYVSELRLERAKKMLLAKDKSVTEIAVLCGFGSPSYLSSCFQKAYQMTPSEYRRIPEKTRQR
jgi:AraC family transcriptional regulator